MTSSFHQEKWPKEAWLLISECELLVGKNANTLGNAIRAGIPGRLVRSAAPIAAWRSTRPHHLDPEISPELQPFRAPAPDREYPVPERRRRCCRRPADD